MTVALPELLKAGELAERIHKSRRWVYRAHDEHGMPAVKVGAALFFDPAAVAEWIDRHRVNGTDATTDP